MSNYFAKQPSSRYLLGQALQYGGTSSVPSTNFSPETFHIRVTSNVSGWLAFGTGSTYGTTLRATAQSSGIYIAANVAPEFVAMTPGTMVAFISTSTSSGCVSICEMS